MIGLLIIDQPFGIVMSGIGVIALAGIVVNHNIILVGTSDKLRHAADSQREAILRTCAQRLRPVMLTTITAILGLLPMVFRVNIDFATREITVGAPSTQWWTQLSSGIVFGLAFATVLTLIVTPSALDGQGQFPDPGASAGGPVGHRAAERRRHPAARQGRGVIYAQPKLRRAVMTRAAVVSQHSAPKT